MSRTHALFSSRAADVLKSLQLVEAQRLRAEGKSIQDVADTIGWSFAQTYRKLKTAGTGEPTIIDVPVETVTLTPPPNAHQKIALASLCLTAGTQMRESLNLATIADYAEAMSDGSKFPPVIVFSDGTTYWLADGFQRVEAAKQIGYVEIEAEIRPGALREAILFACGANAFHGERRTNRDKRKSVLTLLNDAEWSQLPLRRIAEICGVTHPFVAEMRKPKELKPLDNVVTVTTPIHSDEPNTRQDVNERATGEHNVRPEVQAPPSKVTQEGGWTFYEPLDKPAVPEKDYNNNHDVIIYEEPAPTVNETPSPCATCAEVGPLIDKALMFLRSMYLATKMSGYTSCEATLLTVRELVTEKSAVQDG